MLLINLGKYCRILENGKETGKGNKQWEIFYKGYYTIIQVPVTPKCLFKELLDSNMIYPNRAATMYNI